MDSLRLSHLHNLLISQAETPRCNQVSLQVISRHLSHQCNLRSSHSTVQLGSLRFNHLSNLHLNREHSLLVNPLEDPLYTARCGLSTLIIYLNSKYHTIRPGNIVSRLTGTILLNQLGVATYMRPFCSACIDYLGLNKSQESGLLTNVAFSCLRISL